MKQILEKYLTQAVGINIEKPFRIDKAILSGAEETYFSVIDQDNGYTHHFSYQSVIQVIEHQDGIDIGGLFSHKEHHSVIIKVGHLLEYVPV